MSKLGYLESNLTLHWGSRPRGRSSRTLDGVGIHSTWVERLAVRGKSHQKVVESLLHIQADVPFPLRRE